MKKRFFILFLGMAVTLLTGCAGTAVVYYCPTGAQTTVPETVRPVAGEGDLKTGLAVITGVADSQNAAWADFDVTLAAVLVDEDGVIYDCVIDSIGTKVTFDAAGTITSDLTAQILTKNELGDDYGMTTYGGAACEWYQQAAALADFAVGRTAAELRNGAIDASGRAPEGSDLASAATIYLGGLVSAIEEAVNNAKYLGAQAGDTLKLASAAAIDGSRSADGENSGAAQLDLSVTALTVRDGVISSCVIDGVQAKVDFDSAGTITTDLTGAVLSKNQLGDSYGMMAWGGAIAEWDEQAASFAAYVTGKTAGEVAGIAVTGGKPGDADLASSVTISIGGFQELIAKAMD